MTLSTKKLGTESENDYCRLCRLQPELVESHLIPKSIYRIIRESEGVDQSKDPALIDGIKKAAVATSNQASEPLLCSNCEHLFNKNGEDSIIRGLLRNKNNKISFPIRDKIGKCPNQNQFDSKRIWRMDEIQNSVDMGKVIYFVLSILWRNSVSKICHHTKNYRGALGEKYTEEIRRYLLGDQVAPQSVSMRLFIDFSNTPIVHATVPSRNNQTYARQRFVSHMFSVPGITFEVFIGDSAEKFFQILKTRIIVIENDSSDVRNITRLNQMIQHAKPKGKLVDNLKKTRLEIIKRR